MNRFTLNFKHNRFGFIGFLSCCGPAPRLFGRTAACQVQCGRHDVHTGQHPQERPPIRQIIELQIETFKLFYHLVVLTIHTSVLPTNHTTTSGLRPPRPLETQSTIAYRAPWCRAAKSCRLSYAVFVTAPFSAKPSAIQPKQTPGVRGSQTLAVRIAIPGRVWAVQRNRTKSVKVNQISLKFKLRVIEVHICTCFWTSIL